MKKNARHAGVTLVELMIVVAIVGIIFSVGPTLLTNVTKFSRVNTARLVTQRNAREALAHINRSMRQALAQTVVVSQQASQPPYSMITFDTVDERTLAYYQSGKNLMFGDGSAVLTLAEDLRYISFTPPRTDDPNIISVSVTFEKSTYEGGTKALQMAIEKVRIMN